MINFVIIIISNTVVETQESLHKVGSICLYYWVLTFQQKYTCVEFNSPEAEIRVRRVFFEQFTSVQTCPYSSCCFKQDADKKPFALKISTELSLGSLRSNVLMQRI